MRRLANIASDKGLAHPIMLRNASPRSQAGSCVPYTFLCFDASGPGNPVVNTATHQACHSDCGRRFRVAITCAMSTARLLLQLESLPAMVQGVYSEDPFQQLEATTQFRKLLSIGEPCRLSAFVRLPP